MTDKDLYQRMVAGDVDAFNQLFKAHYESLVRMLYKKCFDQTLAEDIVQNVFIELWSKRKERVLPKSVGAYLSTSVKNRYIDHFRKQKNLADKKKAYLQQSLPLNIASPEEELLNQENLAKIYRKIEELPPKTKVVFQLSRFENKSYSEIAEALDISVKTVEYHISNALRLLHESIFIFISIFLLG